MVDHVDELTRSRIMAAVGSKHTKPEMRVRRFLHNRGFRYRLHRKDLPGKPDIVLPKYRLTIFVHGCFWHRHQRCAYASMPKSKQEFWKEKFERNVKRDREQREALLQQGWRVLTIWECGLKQSLDRIGDIQEWIEGNSSIGEWPSVPPKAKPINKV